MGDGKVRRVNSWLIYSVFVVLFAIAGCGGDDAPPPAPANPGGGGAGGPAGGAMGGFLEDPSPGTPLTQMANVNDVYSLMIQNIALLLSLVDLIEPIVLVVLVCFFVLLLWANGQNLHRTTMDILEIVSFQYISFQNKVMPVTLFYIRFLDNRVIPHQIL